MVEDLLPSGFRFGVATAGFQIEGGYNGPRGEPRNNWYGWESAGRVEPSGIALDFWHRAEEQLDRVRDLGCDSFRLSVEWARCEPAEGEVDEEAFARYRQILQACHARGLEPLVTLHHFTHPCWLGEDFWTQPSAPGRLAAHAASVVARLGELCSNWVTLNEPNVLALASYLTGSFPGGRVAGVDRPLWEDPPTPAGLVEHLAVSEEPGLDLWVVENGICNRVRRGRAHPRPDGWTRPRYLRANLEALLRARARGLPVTGYWHWCLADNYEWGSYEPRFGLYGVDRERGVRWSELDSMGDDSAGAYRSLIAALRTPRPSARQLEPA